MQEENVLSPNVVKTLVKGTVAVALLSLFLEINLAHLENYVAFLAIAYGLIGAYMLNKGSNVYTLGDSGIRIKRLYGKQIVVDYDNVQGLAYSQGMLARRFKVGTVYVELKTGRGRHRSPEGRGVILLKDVPDPVNVMKELEDRMSPFAHAQ